MAYKKSKETNSKIIKAATRLFQESGYYDISMENIAKEADIPRTTLYYYFKNKEEIAETITDIYSEELDELIKTRESQNEDHLVTAIISVFLMMRTGRENRLMTPFYDIIDYTTYSVQDLKRLEKQYCFPDIWALHEEYGKKLSQKEKFTFLIMINALSRGLYRGVINKQLLYSDRELVDCLFMTLIVNPLNIPKDVYEKKRKEAFKIAGKIELLD